MVVSVNKGYLLQATGDNVDTWGVELNDEVFNVIDANLGGITSKSLTNVPVNLTADESENLRLVLSGTLTGNVLVQTLAIGMTIIENKCTGAFTVTFRKNGVGAAVPIPNGTNNIVTTGAAGNPELIGVDFPTGTRIPFQQTNPPVGYTKDTATVGLNNSVMRMTTGTVSIGGTMDFDDAFNNARAVSGSVGNTTLSVSQIPAHTHDVFAHDNDGSINRVGGSRLGNSITVAGSDAMSSVGSGQPHGHGLTMNNMNFEVRFTQFCIGVKQ